VVEAGGGVVAHRRRLQAAVLLFQTVEGKVPFSSVCLSLLSFSVVSLYPPGLLSSFLPRFKLFLPLRLSLSVVPFLFGSFSLLGSFSVSLRSFSPLCGSFVEMLVVTAWGVAWTVVGPSSFSSLCFFLQLCSSLFLFAPSASRGAVVSGEDSGSLW